MSKIKNEYVVARDRVKLSVGDVIKMSCELNDISQAELAKRAGIQESNLSDIINGRRVVGRAVAEKIAKALNVSPAFILFAGETSREGADISADINNETATLIVKQAIQTIEDNKNKNDHIQITIMRTAIESIARAILSISRPKLAPVELISHSTKHAKVAGIRRKR